MKTTIHSIRIVGTLLTIVVVLASCSSLWALGESGGNFVLPFEVQWNGATLPAGPYHIALLSDRWGGVLIIRDVRQNAKMLIMATALGDTPDRSALTIVRRQGKWYVASLALQGRGATLEYRVPAPTKAEREMAASIQLIPIRRTNAAPKG
jgi:hypothetical protein